MTNETAQVQRLMVDDVGRASIIEMLLSSTGEDLRGLLDAVDASGSHRDLEWLVFSHLGSKQRDAMLRHIARQAKGWTPVVRVVSDMDDTLMASLNDPIYPSGVLYPGVLAFLARCGAGAPVTIVTARPEGRSGVLEDRLRRLLAARGVPTATVLSGSFRNLTSYNAMARRKAANIRNLAALHPADQLVLVGDSGQGDVKLARRVTQAWPGRVPAFFIHELMPSAVTMHRDEGAMLFFSTYVEAAAKAVTVGLLSQDDLAAVVDEAQADLAKIVFRTAAQAEVARASLSKSIMAAGLAI